jgi:hypothetical protein
MKENLGIAVVSVQEEEDEIVQIMVEDEVLDIDSNQGIWILCAVSD